MKGLLFALRESWKTRPVMTQFEFDGWIFLLFFASAVGAFAVIVVRCLF